MANQPPQRMSSQDFSFDRFVRCHVHHQQREIFIPHAAASHRSAGSCLAGLGSILCGITRGIPGQPYGRRELCLSEVINNGQARPGHPGSQRRAAWKDIILEDVGITNATLERYYGTVQRLAPYLKSVETEGELDETIASWIQEEFEDGTPLHMVGDALSRLHHFEPFTFYKEKDTKKLAALWDLAECPRSSYWAFMHFSAQEKSCKSGRATSFSTSNEDLFRCPAVKVASAITVEKIPQPWRQFEQCLK